MPVPPPVKERTFTIVGMTSFIENPQKTCYKPRMSFGTTLKKAFGKYRGPDEGRILTRAEKETRLRSYEAARQQYIIRCEREERAQRKKLERRLNRSTNLRMSFYLFILAFAMVWVFEHGDEICAWWNTQLNQLIQFIGV